MDYWGGGGGGKGYVGPLSNYWGGAAPPPPPIPTPMSVKLFRIIGDGDKPGTVTIGNIRRLYPV